MEKEKVYYPGKKYNYYEPSLIECLKEYPPLTITLALGIATTCSIPLFCHRKQKDRPNPTAIYQTFDTDGNGQLNQQEFENACQKMGVTPAQLEKIVIKAEKEE